jgi:membrane protease YdiL (CAAX protease family)
VPDWSAFAGVTGVVLTLLLVLARLSQDLGQPPARGDDGRLTTGVGADAASTTTGSTGPDDDDPASEVPAPWERALGDDGADPDPGFGAGALLANVAVSQGAFGVLLVAGAWFTEIPLSAFGVSPSLPSVTMLGVGVALGLALYLANEAGSTVGERLGVGADERLREALAPSSVAGWVVLLVVVLPTIAAFEELLFRGVLVGVFAAGFGISPWLLAGLSSVAFALGHGAQGPAGVAVTGVLGFVLAAAFVLTGSLLVVVVAHYLVNALEFVVHEAPGTEWA